VPAEAVHVDDSHEWRAPRLRWRFVDNAPPLAYIQCRYMATTTQLAKWGNSLGLRLPKSIAREAQVGEGDTVLVSVDNGTIVIRPSRPRYSLDELVGRITPKNRHGESDWGGPLGDEAW
jgi:antitoxin MazE